jgi:hypothetical protein
MVGWPANRMAQRRSEVSARRSRTAARLKTSVVSLNLASWNQLDGWLRQIEGLRRAA